MTNETATGPLAVRPREAAKLLSISERTLWTLTQRGEVPAKRIGTGRRRTVLYSVAELRAWLAGGNGEDAK